MAIELADDGSGVRTLTLAGPAGLLDTAALGEMAALLRGLATDGAARALVLQGKDGAFCRGRVGAKGLTRPSEVAGDLNAILAVNAALDALAIPVIAAIEGEALGFGFGLAAQADYAVAAADAVLALPEMSHGLPPLIVLSYLFRFLPYKRALDLAITSRRIGAEEAVAAGVVTEIAPPGTAAARAHEIAQAMTAHDARALAMLRRFARRAAAAHDPALADTAVAMMSGLLAERAQAG